MKKEKIDLIERNELFIKSMLQMNINIVSLGIDIVTEKEYNEYLKLKK